MGYQVDLRQDRSRRWMLALTVVQAVFYLLVLPSLWSGFRASSMLHCRPSRIRCKFGGRGNLLVLLSLYVMIRAFLVLSCRQGRPDRRHIADKDVYEFVRHPFSGAIRCFGQVLTLGRPLAS